MTSQSATKFVLEKGVPIPRIPRGPGALPPLPLHDMEVGDSFFQPGGKTERYRLNSAIRACKRSTGWQFTLRSVDGGFRVWRFA
jgi:hypothetical protein